MKTGRYVLAALTIVIAALVVYLVTRRSPSEAPAQPDSPESPTVQNSKVITNPPARATKPIATAELLAGKAANTTNAPASNAIPSGKPLTSGIKSAAETQAAEAAAKSAAIQSSFAQGPPPATPVAPPPVELFRTNTPEKRPGEGRPFTGP